MQERTQRDARERPYAACLELLRQAGLRPTRQRLALARLLYVDSSDRHVTAEELHAEAHGAGVQLSVATVYNTLHQFCEAGLLRALVIEPGRTHYDTNTAPHHHFYHRRDGRLEDIPAESVRISGLPRPPAGSRLVDTHVVLMLDDVADDPSDVGNE